MVTVRFTGILQRHVDAPPRTVGAGPLHAVLAAVFADAPILRGYVLDDQSRLRKHVAAFINGDVVQDRVALTDPVPDGAEVFLLPALSGG